MTTATDLMPFVGTIGGGFFVGLFAGYAIKKIIKVAAVIVGLFIYLNTCNSPILH